MLREDRDARSQERGDPAKVGEDDLDVEEAFADPNGRMEVDPALDEEFAVECSFSNADISTSDGDN